MRRISAASATLMDRDYYVMNWIESARQLRDLFDKQYALMDELEKVKSQIGEVATTGKQLESRINAVQGDLSDQGVEFTPFDFSEQSLS